MKKYEVQDYEEYKKTQIHRGMKKWTSCTFDGWLFVKVLATAAPLMILRTTGKVCRPGKIVCMGIRNGNEYNSFKKMAAFGMFKDSEIWGVDICPEVEKVGTNCICADFNHLPKDWGGKFDLVYSNSLDHAFDVKQTLAEWERILRSTRFMILTLSEADQVGMADVYSFNWGDCAELFDRPLFELLLMWREYGQVGSFNVLIRVVK